MQRNLNCLTAALAALVIAGCGGGESSTPSTPSVAAPPVIEMGVSDSTATTADSETSAETSEPAAEPSDSASSSTSGPGWGTLRGRIIYDGAVPAQAQLTINKDQKVCTVNPPLNEELVVNAENGGIADVGVWLYLKRGADPPESHPSYEAALAESVQIDNLWCRFEPRMIFVRTGQEVKIGNKDTIGHNTKADLLSNPAFNEIIPALGEISKTFELAERLPAAIGCNIHTWMKGWMIVQDHPYGAVSGPDGSFSIENLPVGEWTFQFWQQRSGYLDEVNVGGSDTKWSKGRLTITIKSGDNNLGDIKVKPGVFE